MRLIVLTIAFFLGGCVSIYQYGNGDTATVTMTPTVTTTVPVMAIP